MLGKYGSFGNFWYYNKLKIFALIFVLALVALGVSQCSLGKTLDLGIVHISSERNSDGGKLLESLKENAGLKKSGEELSLEFVPIYMPEDFGEASELGSIEKTQVEIISGSTTLFILDQETVYSYKEDDIFYDLSDIADKYGIAENRRYLDDDGKVVAISIDQNPYLEECSVFCDELYIAVRNHLKSKADEYENAFTALEYIIAKGD